jgi:hypothetical protein
MLVLAGMAALEIQSCVRNWSKIDAAEQFRGNARPQRSSQRTPLCHQEGMAAPRPWARVLKILSGQLAAVRAALRAHATRPHVKHAAPRGMSALASICAATVRACGSFQTAERARQSQALELARMRSVPSGAVNLAWMFRRHQPPADPSQRAAHEPETLCARSSTKLD